MKSSVSNCTLPRMIVNRKNCVLLVVLVVLLAPQSESIRCIKRWISKGLCIVPGELGEATINDVDITQNIITYFELQKETAINPLSTELCTRFPQLETIDIVKANVNRIHRSMFIGANNLTIFNAMANRIAVLEDRQFSHAPNLEFIDLSMNLITYLSNGYFQGLSKLKTLLLEKNNISVLLDEVFFPLVSLEILHLGKNQIIHWNQMQLSKNPKLQIILLYHNQIAGIHHKSFDNIEDLVVLQLNGNVEFNEFILIDSAIYLISGPNDVANLENRNYYTGPLEFTHNKFLKLKDQKTVVEKILKYQFIEF